MIPRIDADCVLKFDRESTSLRTVGFREVLHGTPYMLKGWLEFIPERIPDYFVRDTKEGVIVTARRYLERFGMIES